MGVISEIIDVVNGLKGVASNNSSVSKYLKNSKSTSINRMAKEGILQTPVLMSTSVDSDVARIIVKALERNYASLVQMAISMNCVAVMDEDKNLGDYLKKFHNNMSTSVDFKSLISDEIIDTLGENYTMEEIGDLVLEFALVDNCTGKILTKHRESLRTVMEDFNMEILNEKFKPKGVEYMYSHKPSILKEANISSSTARVMKNDFEKINDMVPTTLTICVDLQNDKKDKLGRRNFLIGIKAVCHPVSSTEMIANVGNSFNKGGLAFNFIRWTTGEISFLKDLVLNVDKIKTDVVNRSNGASPFWIALKRRSSTNNIMRKLGKQTALPIATLVLTSEEAELIKSEYQLDLRNTRDVKELMNNLCLLGLCIVDTASESIDLLIDGESQYATYGFKSLERENQKGVDAKEMMKLINRF